MEAKGEVVRSFSRTLMRLVEQIQLLIRRIEHHVAACEDGPIVMSFPRAGRLCAAQILAELGSVRERFASDAQLASEAGVKVRHGPKPETAT
jgi:transposase